ncbi:MAG: mechanosensitive ion channel family protein [Nitrososphaeria archaeon]
MGINLMSVLYFVIILCTAYLVGKIVSRLLKKLFEKTPFPEEIERRITRVSKYVVYVIGFFAALSVVGFDITSIVVGLGAFSIAISFATSTIIQNFVSGLLVQADKAIRVGDVIRVQNFEGKVIKVSVRTTIIEQEDGDVVIIPNSIFVSNAVVRKKRPTEG